MVLDFTIQLGGCWSAEVGLFTWVVIPPKGGGRIAMDLTIHLGEAGQIRPVCLHGSLFLLKEGMASTRYVWGLGRIHLAQKKR